MPKLRKWCVAESFDKLIELCPGSYDLQTHKKRIGSVEAINREAATKLAAEKWPGLNLVISRARTWPS